MFDLKSYVEHYSLEVLPFDATRYYDVREPFVKLEETTPPSIEIASEC